MLELQQVGDTPGDTRRHDDAAISPQTWRDQTGRVAAWGYSAGGCHWLHLPSVAAFCFRAGDRFVTAVPDAEADEERVLEAFRRTVLPLALQALGREALHASGVVSRRGVVAVCGTSGVGKSTLAYGLFRRGYELWADDAVVFEASAGSCLTIPLPFSMRLRSPARAHFSLGERLASGEVVVGSPQGALRPGLLPLAAILVLRRAADKDGFVVGEIQALSPAKALAAVSRHAYCFTLVDAERKRRMLESYFELAVQVPVFLLTLRECLDDLPAVLDVIEWRVFDGRSGMPCGS